MLGVLGVLFVNLIVFVFLTFVVLFFGWDWPFVWFFLALTVLVGLVFGFGRFWFLLESLILAQDERWRRA